MFFFFIHYSKVNPHCYIFSSPELKAQWWAYRIGRPLLSVCVCAVGMSTCRTSSPLKPLGWLKPNFIWSLLGTGERKSVETVQVTWPRWPPCPYMLKTVKKSSSSESKGRWPWNLVCSIGCSSSTKFVQMMTLGWAWPILRQGQIWSLVLLYWKKVKQSIFQKLL